MGSCAQTAHDFITNAFPAIVGTLASEDAEFLCQKNDLSFVELIRPFCQLDSEAQIHDPVNPNIVIQVKKMKIRLVDIQSSLPPPCLMNRVLTEVVSKTVSLPDFNSALSLPDQIASATPWYEAYRDCFFQLIQPMNHEFIRDILACILVVSTKHADPLHAFAALSTRQNSIQHASDKPKTTFNWFGNNTFKYYLLLHDASEGEDGKAEAVYQKMKSVYGSHTCFLLQINSRQKMYPQANETKMSFSDPWTQHIYPFSDETFDIDEAELEKDTQTNVPEANQKDADKKEEAIINELESIDRQIEQNPESTQPVTFNDPLTSMHYNDMLDNDTEDLGPLAPSIKDNEYNNESVFRPRKLSERTLKMQEYKRNLRQLSYTMVSNGCASSSRKERGHYMTLVDQDKIKSFVYEFIVRGLLPYIEKLMRKLSEQIVARRGLHKSIFHATKKWFGSNKASGGGVGYGFSAGSSYSSESTELQYRKLGDLSFLVQHYDLAYNSYHSAKREFNNDHAWMYFAGALEMAAISAFMQGTVRVYPLHYFDACISTYLNTCRIVDYATRACLMSTEALISSGMYQEAAVEFIKLTNEDSDLRSALLLEQAAHCYIHHNPPMIRKYAFHMILAGHRYSKAAQRKHTLRCYISALQVYANKGWHLAEDHVNFIIGRQSFNLGKLDDSQLALKSLLLYESEQQPSQQASYLREFLAVFKQNLESVRNKCRLAEQEKLCLPDLPLPKIKYSLTRCLLYVKEQTQTQMNATPLTPSQRRTRTIHAGNYSFQRNYSKSYIKRWAELERKVVTVAKGHAPYPFKPFCPCLSSDTDNQVNPIVAVEELFAYEVQFLNPLKIPLNLLNLSLLWEFTPSEDPNYLLSNKETDHLEYIWAEKVTNFQLKPSESKPVHLKLSAKVAGKLKVLGIKYTLSSMAVTSSVDEYGKVELSTFQEAALNTVGVMGMQELLIKGPRMNSTKKERAAIVYTVDRRLEPHILPALPLLEIKMTDLPVTLLCGEVQKSIFHFKNIGRIPLKNLYVICNRPQFFSYGHPVYKNDNVDTLNSSNSLFNLETADDGYLYMKMNDIETLRNNDVIRIPLANNQLACDSEISLPVFVYGLDIASVHEINFVFYYEPFEDVKGVPYRLVQQMIRIQTLSSLTVSVSTRFSNRAVLETTDSNTAQIANEKVANEELLISLSIENEAQTALNLRCVEFNLKHLKCFSCSWKVESLVKLSQDTYRLRPGETCSLHLKSRSIEEKQSNVAHICDIPLGDNEKDTQPGEESLDLFMKPVENIDAVLTSLGLILYWETFFIDEGFTRIVIGGQSHMTVRNSTNLGKSIVLANAPNLLPSITRGINISYDYPSIVRHDFINRRLCVVEINVKCSNVTNRNVVIEIEAVDLHEDSVGSDMVVDKHSLNLIQWVGRRQISMEVGPHSTRSLGMHALFGSIGVYEIQNLNAYVDNQPEGGLREKVSLNLPSSHLICIENALNNVTSATDLT